MYEIRLGYSHKIRYIIICHVLSKSPYIYIWPIWLQTVLEHIRRSTWRHQLRELRDALEGRDPVNWEMY